MRLAEGKGVNVLLVLSELGCQALGREKTRSLIDGLTDERLADVLEALSAADVAAGGTGNLFYESAAARLRGIDVETHSSKPEGSHASEEA